jgi:DNA mismatch repair protein MSH3
VGDNRNTPFTRKVTNLYTKGTYIDDVEVTDDSTGPQSRSSPAAGYLLCLTESKAKGWGSDEKVHVGLVAVQPSVGDIIYDDFEDGFMRSEIETRLLHIAPCEILIVGDLSKATGKLVHHLSGSKANVFGDRIRLDRIEKPKTMAATAFSHVSGFYAEKLKESVEQRRYQQMHFFHCGPRLTSQCSSSQADKASNFLEKIHSMPEHVTVCLSAMISHLSEYGLHHVLDLTKYFQSFSARSHMLLNGNTLTSLEIYHNQTDHTEKGSLFWTLDRTQTRFGQRLLRKWVGRPLLDKCKLEERVAAVEELKGSVPTAALDRLKHVLGKIVKGDLERTLIRVYYRKCGRPELLGMLQTLQRIAQEFVYVKAPADAGFQSNLVNDSFANLPRILEDVIEYLEKINAQAAKDDDKYEFFREMHESDAIVEHKHGIARVEQDLDEHRKVAAEKLKKKMIDYVKVAQIEYLIEVENDKLKNVPASWIKISGTKKVSRFHTPEVIKLTRERDQHKESLAAACDAAFQDLLSNISSKYQAFRDCIQSLALLDCLLSLAEVANQPGYVRPEFTKETCVSVKEGRHPMVEQLLLETYVPNDIELSADGTRSLLITGPNMGGKSSYVRQVALIAIMGQIGSYVPATSAKLGMLDAVFTRMGAFDNMLAGESTFMVELHETADILKQASPRSLVILDELGRGTSTHDGVAIAQAVLDFVVRDIKSLTLFITHYQNLSSTTQAFNGELKNVHMKFTEESGPNGEEEVTFLYEVGEGVAHRSYG